MEKVELLSPVGNMDGLKAAIMNGADAVYLGGKKYGARHYADNFTNEEMVEAIKLCHLYGVRIYVTVNTLIFESELEEALEYVEFLYTNGVDALIMQDLGLISLVRNKYPNLEIHASTQCHNHNKEVVETFKNMGVKRCVFARELSLDEIKNIDVDIEKEVFVHGALCVCYSGCCLFSAMNGGRSGNRGECVGVCRLPFKFSSNNNMIDCDGDYPLSTKSLCTITKIKELIESGVKSFKIEGRMKSTAYISYVTRLYRSKIDDYYNNKDVIITNEEINNLKKIYNREFTLGYLFNSYGKELMNIKTSNHLGIHLGKVVEISKKYIKLYLDEDLTQEDGLRFGNDKGLIVNYLYDEKLKLTNKVLKNNYCYVDNKINLRDKCEVRKTIDIELSRSLDDLPPRKVNIDIKFYAKLGKPLKIVVSDFVNEVIKEGSITYSAEKCPTSSDRIIEQLSKLGNTPYLCNNIDTNLDSNIFVSIKELNELRRNALDELSLIRMNTKKEVIINRIDKDNYESNTNNFMINVFARDEGQVKTLLDLNCGDIYISNFDLYKKYSNYKNVYYRTKRLENNYKDLINSNILCTELGAVSKYSSSNNCVSDYFMNITNSNSIKYLLDKNVKRVCLSCEVPIKELESMNYLDKVELFVYGRVELMITKYCPLNMIINKDNKTCNLCMDNNKYAFVDQNNNKYPVINEKHITHILDYKNINLINYIGTLKEYGINSYRVDLFDENREDIIKIINNIKDMYE